MFDLECRGSAPIVEMSFVLPFAMAIVLSLMCLAVEMFSYAYSYSIAEIMANELYDVIGENDLYWQLKENYVSSENAEQIVAKTEERLKGLCVLPGTEFEYSYSVKGKLDATEILVEISQNLFSKKLYTVSVRRNVYVPSEFANNVDTIFEFMNSCDGLSKADEIFAEIKGVIDEYY